MNKPDIHSWLGIVGIHPDENERTHRVGAYLEGMALLVALWIVVVWYLESTKRIPVSSVLLHDRLVWAFFLVETTVLTWLVDDKRRYLRDNWLNVAIIVTGIPFVLGFVSPHAQAVGSLRLILVIDLLLKVSGGVRKVLSRNQLGATLVVTALFTTGAGFLIDGIDPNIDSPADGIWWAWVTMTTVGYGDVVPVSPEGRVFGVILMLVGMAFSALITAGILAFFISENEERIVSLEETELVKQSDLEARMVKVEQKLDDILTLLQKRAGED